MHGFGTKADQYIWFAKGRSLEVSVEAIVKA
jgi:hypothetical protein